MTKLILHIGHPKTGTTTLQSTLRASRGQLLSQGILYPRTRHFANHKAIAAHFMGTDILDTRLQRLMGCTDANILAAGKSAWDMVVDDIAQTKPDTIVLSAEHFFGVGRSANFPSFIDGLRSLSKHITVAAYLRDPTSHYLSSKQQSLKSQKGFRPTTPDYFQAALTPYQKDDRLDLNVHKFSRSALLGNDIVSDFSTRYLTANGPVQLVKVEDNANTTMSAEAMQLIEQLRSGDLMPEHAKSDKMVNKLVLIARRCDDTVPGKTRPGYKPGVAAAIYYRRTDLDWVQDQFGISFDRPKADGNTTSASDDRITSTKDLCEMNEDRAQALLDAFSQAVQRDQSILRHYDEFLRNISRWRTRAKTAMRTSRFGSKG